MDSDHIVYTCEYMDYWKQYIIHNMDCENISIWIENTCMSHIYILHLAARPHHASSIYIYIHIHIPCKGRILWANRHCKPPQTMVSIHPSIYLSIYQAIYLSIYLSPRCLGLSEMWCVPNVVCNQWFIIIFRFPKRKISMSSILTIHIRRESVQM